MLRPSYPVTTPAETTESLMTPAETDRTLGQQDNMTEAVKFSYLQMLV